MERNGDVEPIPLAPGFRFHPTDEELITHYLSKKVMDPNFNAVAIGEVDLNKCEPWDLPWKAKMGEKEWYFFCVRDRKYPTGMRTNRATESGYWKATGKDKVIYRGKSLVGMKKTLVFYRGRAPKGDKTSWVMHEYRLDGNFSVYNLPKTTSKNEWVISRVFKKSSNGGKKEVIIGLQMRMGSEFGGGSYNQNPLLPPLMYITANHNNNNNNNNENNNDEGGKFGSNIAPAAHVTCFSNASATSEGVEDDRGGLPPNLADYYFNNSSTPSIYLSSAFNNNNNSVSMLPPAVPCSNLNYSHMSHSSSGQSLLQLLLLESQSSNVDNEMLTSNNNHISQSQSQEESTGLSLTSGDHVNPEISSFVSNQKNKKQHSFDTTHSPAASQFKLEHCLWNYPVITE